MSYNPCAKCPKPMNQVGYFRNDNAVALCEEHHDQHLATAFKQEARRKSEREWRAEMRQKQIDETEKEIERLQRDLDYLKSAPL